MSTGIKKLRQPRNIKSNRRQAINAAYLSIAVNAILAIVKGVTGFLGNSYALIADAIESTTDIFSSSLVLFGLIYATKPPDEDHPYGHGRAEPLVTFAVVGFLVIAAAVIVYESILKILTPHEIPEKYTLYVLAVVILTKEFFFRMIASKGERVKSLSLKADAWHHRSDAITSALAFVGISIAIFMGNGYESADDWAALIAAGFIVYNAYLIFRPALGEIMDEHLYEDMVIEIREIARKVDGVIDTEKCFVRKAGMIFYVDLHLIVDGTISVKAGHTIAHNLKERILERFPEIADILIHVEPAQS